MNIYKKTKIVKNFVDGASPQFRLNKLCKVINKIEVMQFQGVQDS